MSDHRGVPGYEESLDRLGRSGWMLRHSAEHISGVGIRYTVVGVNGENRIRADAMSLSLAWHRATGQAAACGMLAGWPRPAIETRSRGGAGKGPSRSPASGDQGATS